MYRCTKCKTEKEATEFHKRSSRPNGLKSWCKVCANTHETSKSPEAKKIRFNQIKVNEKVRRLELFEKLKAYTEEKGGCKTCGELDYVVLEFDHRDRSDKSFTISSAVGRVITWNKLLIELEKCDILCANCHRRKTAIEMNWYK